MKKVFLPVVFVLLWGAPLVACQKSTAIPMEMPTLGIGSTMTGEDSATLIYVPAGEFTMGSDNSGTDAKPVHTVYLDAFWIDQTEVTNGMYAKCVTAGKCDPPSTTVQFSNLHYANYPVVYVSWYSANAYCTWADRRLPTEAEWEKAARGEYGNEWPWGNEFDLNKCNSSEGSEGGTTPVGAYSPQGDSPYGVADMAGNVWEWCHSLYQPYPYNVEDGRESASGTGARVVRGGAFYYNLRLARAAFRYWPDLGDRLDVVGLRAVIAPRLS
jgi:formylglycine-generating enzyme required for sulfatase activity